MTVSDQAVFLSYASEDAEAAARLSAGLRAHGIEVWFDQSELRGGDAWDHHIRRQIRDCALFVPIISAHTQSRPEGYFRLEWDLADQRSHMIVRSKAFIVPVCVDGTPDRGALVPESFTTAQWTRLPSGTPTPAFCERVALLLGVAPSPSRPAEPAPSISATADRKSVHWTAMTALGVAALAVAGLIAWRFMLSRPIPGGAAASGASTTTVTDKSIAVLPFVDMSEKHDQEYFSDGLSEELIDRLAHNADLRVIARTSSFAFKGKNEDMRAIAAKLGVAHLLEGSVRKAGAEMRITAQLIRATDGVHLWSETYDRKLTDVFKVQDEIAGTVATALQATLRGSNGAGTEKTGNMEAHNLYLQGRYFAARGTVDDMTTAAGYLQRAVQVDPNYAAAWAQLGQAYLWLAGFGNVPVAETTEKSRAAVKTALRLDPKSAEAHGTLSVIHNSYDFDWSGAQAEVAQAMQLEPRNPVVLQSAGSVALALGDLDKAAGFFREITRIDPLDSRGYLFLGLTLFAGNRLDEAMQVLQAGAKVSPGRVKIQFTLGQVALAMGRPAEARAYNEAEQASWYRLTGRAIIEDAQGNRAASDVALAQLIKDNASTAAAQIAEVYSHRGDREAAVKWLERGLADRDPGARWLKSDPLYAAVRSDPRYPELLKKAGLPLD